MMFRRNCAALVALMLFSTGCSYIFPAWKVGEGKPAAGSSAKVEKRPPLKLAVDQAFVVGEALHVKAIVTAEGPVDPKTVAVTLKGLTDGELKHEDTKSLADAAVSGDLKPGARAAIWFEMPAAEINEYELTCSWGRDATEKLSASRGAAQARANLSPDIGVVAVESVAVPQRNVVLTNVRTERSPVQCSEPPCDEKLTVVADIRNETASTVQSLRLFMRMVWVPEGARVPAAVEDTPDAEVISLPNLNLLPNETQEIRLDVAEPVPSVPGGRFEPIVQVAPETAK